MKRLTKRRALEIGLRLWNWLARDSSRSKKDWPGWKQVGEMDADCPCCEYMWQHKQHCGNCLVRWPHGLLCTEKGSPFRQWYQCRKDKRKTAAQKVAQLHRDALKKLDRREHR